MQQLTNIRVARFGGDRSWPGVRGRAHSIPRYVPAPRVLRGTRVAWISRAITLACLACLLSQLVRLNAR